MQNQYRRKEGFGKKVDGKWDGWYGSKEEEMRLLPDLRFSNKAKICSVHREPITIGATRSLSVSADLILVGDGSKPDILESEITEASPTFEQHEPKTLDRWYCEVGRYLVEGDKVLVPEFEKKDVIKTCESIIEYLDNLVDECEAKFG
jgi:hypothetical protein